MKESIQILCCLLIFASCKEDAKKSSLPNTPEDVVVAWQRAIDQNDFELARALSMEQALSHIEFLDGIFDDEEAPLEEDENTMLNLSCAEESDGRVRCEFVFEVEPESVAQVPRHLYLKKDENQWKVQWVDDLEAADWSDEEDVDDLLFPPEDSLD